MTKQLYQKTSEREKPGFKIKRPTCFFRVSISTLILIVSLALSHLSGAQVIDSAKMNAVDIKTFHSKILGENRTLFIQTPSKMKSTDQYPVLYLLDGESFINMAGGQIHYLSESYKIIPSMIIVGIKSVDRFKDLTPTHSITGGDGKPDSSSNSPLRTSGGADKFLQFMKEELFPYIDTNYPTAPYRILYGHSLGGLLVIHALVNYPDFFNAYIAISPSLQWDSDAMLKMAAEKLDAKKAYKKMLFFSDANEDTHFHQNQLILDSLLKQKKLVDLNYKYAFYPLETHISEPVKGFYDGIRHIYPNWHLPYNSSSFRKTMRSAMIIKHYQELSAIYHYNVLPPQDEMNAISRFLANDPSRIKDAIELLEMNARNYPKSSYIHEIMGDVFLKMTDREKAKNSYLKAMSLDPANIAIKEKLQKLNH
jgi:predicted alpha/beta superfamily hydrolase